jgi:hypothetical protein
MHVSFSRGAPRKNEACPEAARRMPLVGGFRWCAGEKGRVAA